MLPITECTTAEMAQGIHLAGAESGAEGRVQRPEGCAQQFLQQTDHINCAIQAPGRRRRPPCPGRER